MEVCFSQCLESTTTYFSVWSSVCKTVIVCLQTIINLVYKFHILQSRR